MKTQAAPRLDPAWRFRKSEIAREKMVRKSLLSADLGGSEFFNLFVMIPE
jgi:hypothetical protein